MAGRVPPPQYVELRTHATGFVSRHDLVILPPVIFKEQAVVGNTPEEFRKYLHADVAKWAEIVKESGAKLY